MIWIALLFIVLPAAEIALLIQVGGVIGPLNTFAIVVITGVVGAALAKREGLSTMQRIQAATAQGQLPTDALVDGAIILVSGVLLMTPGLITDALGFLGLLPGGRELIKAGVMWWARRSMARGSLFVAMPGRPFNPGDPFGPPPTGQPYTEAGRPGTVVDVDSRPIKD